MSSNPNNLDLISAAQSQKEATANALFTAASSAMVYGRRENASSGLVWAFYGGVLKLATGYATLANGTVTLTDASTNYIEADLVAGVVSANTAGFTTGRLALYQVTTVGGQATAWVDYRQALLGAMGSAAVSFLSLADVPHAYTGAAGKVPVVNGTEDGLTFAPFPTPTSTFVALTDTPASYVGSAGLKVVVNATEDGLEFVPDGTGTVVHDTLVATFDAGSAVLDAGATCEIFVPIASTITGCTLIAGNSGSVVLDVKSASYASYPTLSSIVGGAPPTIATASKSQDTTLTGWTTAVAAGTILRVSITSATTISRVSLILSTTRGL